MSNSPLLQLPFLAAAQAQKHVSVNEALAALDTLVQLAVIDQDLAQPPGAPNDGDRYIVATAATGDWATHEGEIAVWQAGIWLFHVPQEGWTAWVSDENLIFVWTGSEWEGVNDADLQNTPLLGLNTTADVTNRLSVSAPATLLNHEGAGHQVKVNKNAVGDTASFLFQTGFSGRAEIGLTGNDDFHFKVSPDGSNFFEAITIDKDNGKVGIGATNPTATLELVSPTAASSSFSLLGVYSGGGADQEFNLRGDGNGFADGAFTGGGADYAEFFEWHDGNPDNEDRRGVSVVLEGEKIKPAVTGETPFGVISGNPSVVGDAAWNKWPGKYLKDDFGSYKWEEDPSTGHKKRILSPKFNPDLPYKSREQRQEWGCVGLLGKLAVNKTAPVAGNWIKMKKISETVDLWLVK